MKVAIVEENQIVRLGMSHIVEGISCQIDLMSVSSLADCQSAYPDIKPDIVLKVVRRSEQVDHVVTKFVHPAQALFPGSFVILLSGDMRRSTIQRYFNGGVKGYLDKTADPAELQDCIEQVAKGGRYLNIEVIYKLLRGKGAEVKGGLKPRKSRSA